jgi:hypothetical protein
MSGGGLSPLTASDFAGGEATVARVLARLGFELHRDADVARPDSRRNPPWSDEELILALDLYLRDGPLDGKDGRVVELSKVLNALTIHADRPDAERFRNPNAVALKLANFSALDPGYRGKGMTRGGRRDAEVWATFSRDEDGLREAAEYIRRGLGWVEFENNARTQPRVSAVDVEASDTLRFQVDRQATTLEAERREQQLVRDYKIYLMDAGHTVVRHRYDFDGRSLYCDLFDETARSLHEAKGDVRRESVRMAVGQLLDYARFYEQRPRMVLLLPRRPTEDIERFVAAVGIELVHRASEGRWIHAGVSAPDPDGRAV